MLACSWTSDLRGLFRPISISILTNVVRNILLLQNAQVVINAAVKNLLIILRHEFLIFSESFLHDKNLSDLNNKNDYETS